MNRNWIIVGALVSLTVIAGYFFYQAKKIGDFKIKLGAKKIIQATLERVQVELTLQVHNDSDVDIIINSYDVDLTVDNNFVSKLKSGMSQLVRAKGASDFKLLLDFNPKVVLKQAFNLDFIQGLLTKKSNMIIGLTGSVSIMNGLKNIPINIQSRLSDI